MSEIKVAGSLTEYGFYRCYKCGRMINEGDEYIEADGYSYCMKCGKFFTPKPQCVAEAAEKHKKRRCPICEFLLEANEESFCEHCLEMQGQQLIWEAMSRNERTESDGAGDYKKALHRYC